MKYTTALLLLCTAREVSCFSPLTVRVRAASATALTAAKDVGNRHPEEVAGVAAGPFSRRAFGSALGSSGALVAAAGLVGGLPLAASARPQGPASKEEIARIKKGYDGLEYLLANFDKETTKCTPECNRNPDVVRTYMGLRSMDHPLYQAEKVLAKGQDNIDDVDELDEYITACENYSSAISESNAMAYTSSFGEYNPGGGKDEVEKYLQLARTQVVYARDNLKIILTKLGA